MVDSAQIHDGYYLESYMYEEKSHNTQIRFLLFFTGRLDFERVRCKTIWAFGAEG